MKGRGESLRPFIMVTQFNSWLTLLVLISSSSRIL